MKVRITLVALFVLLSTSVMAADKPPMDLAIYPGGESSMEVNLTNEDLLPMLQAMLPMMSGKMGAIAEKINMDDLAAALKDVKRVEVMQVSVTKQATEADVADFYAKKAPTGTWNRVFWQKAPKIGTVALFVQGTGEGLYGYRVESAVEDNKPVKKILVAKTEGKIDYVKLLTIASKLFMQ